MKQIEQRISSRDAAEMMEMEHKHVLRKIDEISKDLTETKNGLSKYWVEGQYKDTSGKSNREYQITKRGCEFLAHKTTGTKGNLFTDRYMDKFEEMKETLKTDSINTKSNDASDVKLMNARSRMANTYLRLAKVDTLSKEYKNILISKASQVLAGEELIPLPKLTQKTMTSEEVGKDLGISSNMVGRLANKNGLKQEGVYGEYRRDKSRYSSKEVDTFVYYPCVLDEFRKLL